MLFAGGINLKVVLYLVTGAMLILVAAYYGTFYVMPSVSIINNSGVGIESATIKLPSSHLDFGPISQGQTNTIHYSLQQADGIYDYNFDFADGESIHGKCGYVTQGEINKRVSLIISKQEVTCD
jgi:hypothetical protein